MVDINRGRPRGRPGRGIRPAATGTYTEAGCTTCGAGGGPMEQVLAAGPWEAVEMWPSPTPDAYIVQLRRAGVTVNLLVEAVAGDGGAVADWLDTARWLAAALHRPVVYLPVEGANTATRVTVPPRDAGGGE